MSQKHTTQKIKVARESEKALDRTTDLENFNSLMEELSDEEMEMVAGGRGRVEARQGWGWGR